jgi:ABC-type histidine transport system ATPase subunit
VTTFSGSWNRPASALDPELVGEVLGASYSGTELVAQLRALADAAAQQMGFDPVSVRFVLLDLAEQVMLEVGENWARPR